MNPAHPLEPIVSLLVPLLAGFGLGLLYFEALRRTVTLFAAGAGWFRPVALTLGRISIAVIVLAIAARMGTVALLVTFAGFLLARTVALYRSRRAG